MDGELRYNPLNPSDPVLPDGVPLSKKYEIITQGSIVFLIIFLLSNGLLPEVFKKKVKPAIVVYAILQILLVVLIVVPDKERHAAAEYARALKPIVQRTVQAWYDNQS